jgi:hypothetical protein
METELLKFRCIRFRHQSLPLNFISKMEFYHWFKNYYTVYLSPDKIYKYISIKFYNYWREIIRVQDVKKMISMMYKDADPIHGLVYYFGSIEKYNVMNIVLEKILRKKKESFIFPTLFAQFMVNMTDENLGKLRNRWGEQSIITSMFYNYLANKNIDWIDILSKVGINKNTIYSVIGNIKLIHDGNLKEFLLKDLIKNLDELKTHLN